MGDKLNFERFIWFDRKVRAGTYPNARHLSEKFEISPRTAQRTIEFVRDRISAPLEYDYEKKGYYYSDSSYEFPSLWFDEENIIALSLAVRLASSVPDSGIKTKLCTLIEEIFSRNSADRVPSFGEISERVSVKNIEYSRVDEKIFSSVVSALFQKAALAISYYSPHSNKKTDRTILPLHLIHYLGSWHLIAYCSMRRGLRDFALSRIKAVHSPDKGIEIPRNLPSIKDYTRKNFGIMQGGRTHTACLRFTPSVAGWIAEQIWHSEQKVDVEKDGSLIMKFPVADFRELRRKILSYGAEVKVISPKKLADEIKEEIERMKKIY